MSFLGSHVLGRSWGRQLVQSFPCIKSEANNCSELSSTRKESAPLSLALVVPLLERRVPRQKRTDKLEKVQEGIRRTGHGLSLCFIYEGEGQE